MVMIRTLVFGECDHEGDLDTYAWEVANSGGRIAEKKWNARQKIGIIEIQVNDEQELAAFMNTFKNKNSSFFLRNIK